MVEYCCECDEPTGRAGKHDDSIYILYENEYMVGPLCESCRDKRWVCEDCGMGVYPEQVTFEGRHDESSGGCGGVCT